jgi:ADP-ribosyl-[dinitrogen reductase] hydrolase
MEVEQKTMDRYRGCLIGLAVGDALGASVEFMRPGTFDPVKDIEGGGAFGLSPGQWTDDTSMALCLAESLIERKGFDPVDQLERYVRWYREGHLSSTGDCFGMGGTVHQSLKRFMETHEPYSGSTDPRTAGNGSIMRLAPVPMFYANSPEEAIERSAESSRTTHGALTALDACRYLGGVLVGALNGVSKEELLSDHYCPVPGYWGKNPLCKEIDEIASGSFKTKKPPEIIGSGYVVKSLEAALWAFYRSESFRKGCLLAVNLGYDADTTAAVYGQLAGAYYGYQKIPQGWRSIIAYKKLILDYAKKLFEIQNDLDGKRSSVISVCAMSKIHDNYRVWIFDKEFRVAEVNKDNEITIIDDREFKDYETFWGIYGKFNPYLGFLPEEKWKQIKALTYKNLEKIYPSFKMTG